MNVTELLWKKYPILNDGFICLSDVMGNDAKIASRARTSYGNDTRDEPKTHKALEEHLKHPSTINYTKISTEDNAVLCVMNNGDLQRIQLDTYNKLVSNLNQKDTDLIRRLMRDRHTSPFEFCTVEFLVRAPIYVFRQWHRHRTASINEYSGRYKEMIDSMEVTNPDKWRLQSGKNKQGSDGYLNGDIDQILDNANHSLVIDSNEYQNGIDKTDAGSLLSNEESLLHKLTQQVYKLRLSLGVAKEQARKDLPVSNYSEMYWSCNLHNLLHFLTLRMDLHAQEEIRLYANQIGEIVKQLFPVTWQAFEDYRLNAMQLTALDIRAMQNILTMDAPEPGTTYKERQRFILEEVFTNKTEREECITKLTKLGIL